MKTLRNDEIHTMGREEYAVYALEKFNAEHVDDFMTGSCGLDTFRDLWDNHHSMAELDNGDIICVTLKK